MPEKVTKGDDTYTVTTIGKYAFATLNDRYQNPVYNTDLESVILPGSIQTIERYAFIDCTKLSSLTTWNQDTSIPDGITTIHEQTFDSCTSLNCFIFPDSITSIEHGAFSLCFSLSKITLPEKLTTVGNAAFGAAGLTNITIPKSLKEVGEAAFASAINTVTYTGTETAWQELLSSTTFEGTDTVEDSNPQLKTATNYYYAHTVTFDVGEHGTAPDPQVVKYNYTVTPPSSDPTENGYTFMGWYTAPDGDEKFNFGTGIIEDTELFAHWEEEQKKPDPDQSGTQQPGNSGSSNQPNNPGNSGQPTDKPNTDQTTPSQKPNEPTPPDVPAVEEDDTAAIGYAAAAVTAAFVGWGAYRIGSEVYLKYLLPKDVLLPQNRIQLAELLWEDAGRPAPADAAPYADVDANDTDARQAARWAVENGLLTLPDAEKPEEFVPYRSVSYAKSARAWNKAQQLKENAAAR